jgi:hypothetical protein
MPTAAPPRLSEAELMAEARSWVAECQWREDPEYLEDLTDDEIRRGVNRHYDGGWQQFASDANCEVPLSRTDRENTMSEATTYGASITALQTLDQKAQECEMVATDCATGAQEMTSSQATLDAALTKFKLDQRTLAASKRTQEATAGLEGAISTAKAAFCRLAELTETALESVGGHRRLAQAVQEHGEAAQQGWYHNGR